MSKKQPATQAAMRAQSDTKEGCTPCGTTDRSRRQTCKSPGMQVTSHTVTSAYALSTAAHGLTYTSSCNSGRRYHESCLLLLGLLQLIRLQLGCQLLLRLQHRRCQSSSDACLGGQQLLQQHTPAACLPHALWQLDWKRLLIAGRTSVTSQ